VTLSILLTTEGTYPHASGGVSTWCDALLRHTPDVQYVLLPLMMNPHVESKFDPPPNVRRILNVPLWGIEEPAEFTDDIPFARLYDRKRRTTADVIEQRFIPLLRELLAIVNRGGADAPKFGVLLVAMEDYFRTFDYNDTFKSRPVWRTFVDTMQPFAPPLFELTESLRWLYHFLVVLNVRVPRTSVTHSTAAAFCGIPCITAKVRYGTPMVLTEHGVYLREQYLFLSRFQRLHFARDFLLNLITSVVRANYHFADVVAPVCHYNTRWEIAHETPQPKIRVIYNGVDPDVFAPAPANNAVPHIVTTARIDPLKDIETLLRVAARLKPTHPAARFTVYGTVADEAYYKRCLALAKHLGVDGMVTMGTPAADVVAAYRDADVVLLTSISEAFPYSVLEAMSCEKAVVASDVGGVSEALEGCGVLVRPRDDETFAAEVARLLDNRTMRQRLGARARARVLEDFRLDHSIASYLAMYRDLASRRAAA
jgi:glycosyltransferase involved in cell wall biosynthesis